MLKKEMDILTSAFERSICSSRGPNSSKQRWFQGIDSAPSYLSTFFSMNQQNAVQPHRDFRLEDQSILQVFVHRLQFRNKL